MSAALRAGILGMARANHVMTLATHGPGGPWAAALFYAVDDELQFYFISSPDTRHARELEADPRVAVAVSNAAADWSGIRGLQIEALASVVPPAARERAERLYLDRFPEVEALLTDPHSPEFRRIADRFASSRFYRVAPRRIRLIDNARSFGYREEYVV